MPSVTNLLLTTGPASPRYSGVFGQPDLAVALGSALQARAEAVKLLTPLSCPLVPGQAARHLCWPLTLQMPSEVLLYEIEYHFPLLAYCSPTDGQCPVERLLQQTCELQVRQRQDGLTLRPLDQPSHPIAEQLAAGDREISVQPLDAVSLTMVDEQAQEPDDDIALAQPFTWSSLDLRQRNRVALGQRLNRTLPGQSPLLVTYLELLSDSERELLWSSLAELAKLPLHLLLVGGDPSHLQLSAAIKRWPMISWLTGADAAINRLAAAAADIALFTGSSTDQLLSSLFVQRYGALPLLPGNDQAKLLFDDLASSPSTGTALLYRPSSATNLLQSLGVAIDRYQQPALWRELVARVMVE